MAASASVVVDASAVVEYLVEIVYSRQAREVIDAILPAPERHLFAPDLIYPETMSALRNLIARRSITVAQGTEAIEDLKRLPIGVTPTVLLVRDAWERRASVGAYDAFYAALAARLGLSLVTADGRLASAISRRQAVVFLGDL
jgi:predicted nucleic acid-binding protein